MKLIKKILHELTHIGVSQDLDSAEARRITYVNYIVLLSAMYLAMRIFFNFSNFVYCLKLFSMNFFVITVLVLNHYHFYRAAKIVTFSAWVAGVAFFTYFYLGGFNEGAFVILFAAVPWPFMLFDHEENRLTIITLLGGLILFFALLITLQFVHPLPITVDLNMDLLRISTTVLTIVTLLLLTWYFHSSNLSALATLRKEKEKLEIAKEAAVAANRAKSAFLANMSHELRTPLNAILGFSELMRRDPGISREQQQNLKTIGRSGEHLLSLINDVLEFSKIEAGRITLNLGELDLHQLLFELEEMFALRARQKGISLDFTWCTDVPRYIRADPNKLRQILINLLANAVRSTETGGVRLAVKCDLGQGDKSDRASLDFEITDSGCGISRREQGRIFDAFYQSDSQPLAQQGTGLGLPISRKFVELMGGALKVKSEVGKGTTFSFDMRLEPTKHAARETHRHNRKVIGLASGQPVFRILVVEDDDNNRNLLVTLLAAVGFEMKAALNGREAVAIWQQWQPHLIWMDLRMPIMNGYEATATIRLEMQENDTGTDTKIIALTANAFEEERLKVIAQGGDDFIRKPFRERDIFEMLRKHLGVRYLYHERDHSSNTAPDGANTERDNLTETIGNIPENLIILLKEAVELSDSTLIEEVIEKIRIENVSLADALSDLASDFAYERILDLVRN